MKIPLLFILMMANAFAAEYKCDLKKDLPKKKLATKFEHNSEKYLEVYTGLYSDFSLSIRKICEYLKKCENDDLEIRKTYSETTFGKKTLEEIKKLRQEFGFDSVDSYLFDKHPLNYLGPVKISHRLKKADRIYYINEDKVEAYFDQVGAEGVLTRLDSNCQVAELVSFSTLDLGQNSIRLKVTKTFCTSAQNKGPTFRHTPEDLKSMGAYFQNPDKVEDQMEGQELCESLIPKPEPMGLVIAASEPVQQVKKKKKSSVKSEKKKKKARSARDSRIVN